MQANAFPLHHWMSEKELFKFHFYIQWNYAVCFYLSVVSMNLLICHFCYTTKCFWQNLAGTFMVSETIFLFLRCASPISKAEGKGLTILKLYALVAMKPSGYWECVSVDISCVFTPLAIFTAKMKMFLNTTEIL